MMLRRNVSEAVIGVLAIISIILLAIESLVSISHSALMGIYAADLIICVIFGVDFIQRLRASENKPRFLKTNGFEILAMVPALALYALGTIPAIAVAFRSLRLVRIVLLLARMKRFFSKAGRFFQESKLLILLGITAFVIVTGAFAALLLDSGTENAQITSFSDAIWWSISTVTTVGYGDIVPSSIAGRIMGMALMVIGIGVMAAFISQVSATLVESRIKSRPEKGGFKATVISDIKNKLDNIDTLSEDDVSLMIKVIRTLSSKGENPKGG